MATKKAAVPKEEKFQSIDFDLFDALAALDKKDYEYIDRLTDEQQKKFVPYMMTHWMSAIKASGDLQSYYLASTEYHANKHLFNEYVSKHPKLQWQMLCAASPGIGKQFHQWLPHLSSKVTQLKETPKEKDVREYFGKIYPKASEANLYAISEAFVTGHKKKVYLASKYPNLKQADIETLSEIVTDDEIRQYEKDSGNS
jgi:hypothetical protein